MHRGILVAFCTLVVVAAAYRQAKRQNDECCLPNAFTATASMETETGRLQMSTNQFNYDTSTKSQLLVKDGIKFYKAVTNEYDTNSFLIHYTTPMATQWTRNEANNCYRQDRYDLDPSEADAQGEFCMPGSLTGRETVGGRTYDIYESQAGDETSTLTTKLYTAKNGGDCIPVYEERKTVVGYSLTKLTKVNYTVRAINIREASLLVPPKASEICAERKRSVW
jgi:hypothetical protein